jgi:hypothetical protein
MLTRRSGIRGRRHDEARAARFVYFLGGGYAATVIGALRFGRGEPASGSPKASGPHARLLKALGCSRL